MQRRTFLGRVLAALGLGAVAARTVVVDPKEYTAGLRRYLALQGLVSKPLAPPVFLGLVDRWNNDRFIPADSPELPVWQCKRPDGKGGLEQRYIEVYA